MSILPALTLYNRLKKDGDLKFGLRIYRSDATTLGRTAAVVGQRCDVDDLSHFDACTVNRTDCRFAAITGALDVSFDFAEAEVVGCLCAVLGGHLSGVGSVLLRTTESHFTSA